MERTPARHTSFEAIMGRRQTRASFLKLVAGGTVAAIGGLSLAACGGGDGGGDVGGGGGNGGDGERGAIGVNLPFVQADVYPPLIAGAKEEAQARGYDLLESTSQLDASAQLSELNAWIARPVAGLTVYPLDQKSLAPVAKRAQDAGIAVVAYGVPLEGADGSSLFNEEQAAEILGSAAGEWVNERLEGAANVATLTLAESETNRLRVDGAVTNMQQLAPGANVVASAEAAAAPDALKAMQSLLQAHPEINLLIAVNDQDLIGASQALKQAGREPETLWMGGFDGSLEAMQRILDGTLVGATAALELKKVGRTTVSVPANIIEGKEPTAIVNDYVLVTNDTPDLAKRLIAEFES